VICSMKCCLLPQATRLLLVSKTAGKKHTNEAKDKGKAVPKMDLTATHTPYRFVGKDPTRERGMWAEARE